ncbi:membrane protein [Streptomyces caatingaensis]|uniref:Membrane protein n=1 Tax=Streptomyces caatingaensis TaxID=1678637 RepID=A0A0K9XAY9_9ACTN|nr:membrane protein [Streptomyces caatingaensis]
MGQQATAKHSAERYAFVAAGLVIVALTAGGFWLSYAHLAEVAAQHGLGASPMRRWAWPATLDAFIVAGELLMLRAGLRQVTDGWAIALTATGSVGSIALNVAGVSGTGPARTVPLLDYVVAAVPPTAALLAFGVLMRQIHQLVEHPVGVPAGREPDGIPARKAPAATPELAATASVQRPDPDPLESPMQAPEDTPRGGRPAAATVDELAEIGRIAAAEKGKLTRAVVRKAIDDKGLAVSSKRLTEVMAILRPDFEANADTGPATA